MIALDTNILVHAHRKDASLHNEAASCLRRLAEEPRAWSICFHSLIEFYGIVSHPKIWDQPTSPTQVEDQITAWRESPSLRILVESADDIKKLMVIAKTAKVVGPMIHDARIASCCLVNGVRELWTVDRDFSRFSGLQTRNPLV
jgi:predicted nucleic acid-binding protein